MSLDPRRVVRALASLQVAVAVMVGLGIACVAATFYEASHGTAAAQRVFYRSGWFAGLIALLAASILFSATERFPWNRHQIGFVAAHAGVLLLLAGSLVSLHAGLDARLALAEGEASDQIALEDEALRVEWRDGGQAEQATRLQGARPGTRLDLGGRGRVELLEYEPNARVGDVWAEGVAGASGPPAVQFTLVGHAAPLTGWLMAGEPGPADVAFGPVVFSLRSSDGPDAARVREETRGANVLVFLAGADGRLDYVLSSRRGPSSTGVVTAGETIATPWMDLGVRVDRVLAHAVRQRVVNRLPAAGREQAGPAVRVRVDTPSGAEESWIAYGETVPLSTPDASAVAWGPSTERLPFRVTLVDFHSATYPGTRMPATYESRVRVDDPALGAFERTISMNHPLHHRGYTLFQASYVDGERQTSILSVSRAPGLPLVYAGTVLVGFGALWMSFLKRWVARRQGQAVLATRTVRAVGATALAGLALFGSRAEAAAADPLASIAVQEGGRHKPLDTFARESARRVTGARAFAAESVGGLEPVDWLAAQLADPEAWLRAPIVRVPSAGLRARLRLPAERDRYSYDELAGSAGVREALSAVQARLAAEETLDAEETEVADLYERLALLRDLVNGSALRIVPGPGTWTSAVEPDGPAAGEVGERFRALVDAERRHDRAGRDAAAAALGQTLRRMGGPDYPSAAALAREVGYNRLKPFRLSWLLYLAAFVALLASLPLASRWPGRAGLALAAAGLAATTVGLALRTQISGRAPVTNMYESVVFVAWGAVALALAFEALYGGRVAATCASGLAVIALVLADNVPILDGSIAPLVPVLRDNMWLTLHVLTITLGYAAFFLAMGLGHVNLAFFLFAPSRESLHRTLTLYLYRSLQVGTLFLAVGTLLGGVWASYSWGRFWGWDPKETWALIALLGYLAVLHGRLAGWLGGFGLALGAIGAFLLVLMAWYGVNYVLGTGLHAYGFGSGGAGWMFGFAAAELLLIVFALARHAAMPARPLHSPVLQAGRS